MRNKSYMFNLTIFIVLSSFFLVGCTEKEKEKDTTKEYKTIKKEKNFSHFYPVEHIEELPNHQTIYLPVYSHVYTSEEIHEPMGITLSIRNTDAVENLLIEKISYYNTYGDLIDSYLDKPHVLKPMASIDFVVDLRDMRGGSGANFIVKWAGVMNLSTPIIQAVMVNNSGNRAFSFITDGYRVK